MYMFLELFNRVFVHLELCVVYFMKVEVLSISPLIMILVPDH
jgi:hypothetical protein